MIGFIICLIILILASGFFSGSETGLMSLNRYRLRHLARHQHRAAKRILLLLKRPDKLLGTLVIGNTFANILASALVTVIALKFWGPGGVFVSTIVLTLIILIFGEVMPKTVAALYSERVANIVSLPLLILLYVFYPIVWAATKVSNTCLGYMGIKVKELPAESLNMEELRSLVFEAGNHMSVDHKNMLLSILDLEKLTVEDVMVPRNEIVSIDLDDDWDDVLQTLLSCQHTRIPLYKGNPNHLIGVVHIRLAFAMLAKEKLTAETLVDATIPAYFIPETTNLHAQLLQFREKHQRFAIIVDEYGEIQGVVTVEDILEEIIGEFATGFAATSSDVIKQADGSYIIDGTILLRDLNRLLNYKFPTDGPKTLSGLIIDYLGDIPQAGIGVTIAGYHMEILQVRENLVKTVKLH